MKIAFLCFPFLLFYSSIFSQENFKFIGLNTGTDTIRSISSMAVDDTGNIFLSGVFAGDDLSYGFLAKYNSNLNNEWRVVLDNKDSTGRLSTLRNLTFTENGDLVGALMGNGVSNIFEVLRFDSSGSIQWRKEIIISENPDSEFSLGKSFQFLEDSFGDFYYAMEIRNFQLFERHILLAKFDQNGEQVFSNLFFSQNPQELLGTDIKSDSIFLYSLLPNPNELQGDLNKVYLDLNGNLISESKKHLISNEINDFQLHETKDGASFSTFTERIFSNPKILNYDKDCSIVWKDSSIRIFSDWWIVKDIESQSNGNFGLLTNVQNQVDDATILYIEYSKSGEMINRYSINPLDDWEVISHAQIIEDQIIIVGVEVFLLPFQSARSFLYSVPIKSLTSNVIEKQNIAVQMFPNPTHEKLVVEISNNSGEFGLELFDAFGKRVFMKNKINDSKFEIERQGWPNGIYFLQLKNTNGELSTYKIIWF